MDESNELFIVSRTISIKSYSGNLKVSKYHLHVLTKRLDRTALTQIIEEEIQVIRKNIGIVQEFG